MHPQFAPFPSQHQVPLQYGPSSSSAHPPPSHMLPTKLMDHHNPPAGQAHFNATRQAPHRFTPSANDQQLAALLTQYSVSHQPSAQNAHLFRHAGANTLIKDDGTNIYTEPTIIEHEVGQHSSNSQQVMGANILTGPPLPPPPPPPVFAAAIIEAATRATPTLNHNNNIATTAYPCASNMPNELRGIPNGFDGKNVPFNYSDLMTKQQSIQESQQFQQNASHSPQTITGQDLEITLNNGEMTQTVLNTSFTGRTHLNPNLLYYYYSAQRTKYLPLCDLLFNIISLTAYVCSLIFDSITAYNHFLEDQIFWFVVSLIIILSSTTLSQSLSYMLHVRERKRNPDSPPEANDAANLGLTSPFELKSPAALAFVHIFGGGVLWRYFKLIVPVDLATVKQEVRDLCVLRMVHGFSESAPMLLLQVYLVWRKRLENVTDFNYLTIFLSLFSLCWALSSFSKNIRQQQLHKLVLTWLGVIFQFFWRIGTITSRVVALTVFATVYGANVFLILFVHWFMMFLWLSAYNLFSNGMGVDNVPSANEKNPTPILGRIRENAIVAWVWVFCFINMEETNPRYRMTAYYLIMFIENLILLLCFTQNSTAPWYRQLSVYLVLGGFLFGLFFMFLYYQFFHIRYLKHTLDGVDLDAAYNAENQPYAHSAVCNNDPNLNALDAKASMNHIEAQNAATCNNAKAFSPMARLMNALSSQIFPGFSQSHSGTRKLSTSNGRRDHFSNDNIPGVFNCRLNPALKRKKKIPSTVPPPPQHESAIQQSAAELGMEQQGQAQHKRYQLETINETNHLATSAMGHQYRRYPNHQIQRPSTNTSILAGQMRQPGADTFWRKSALSARSLSISPSAMAKSESAFRLPTKHPFSSTIRTPTSPADFIPTENFTDKLLEQNHQNASTEQKAILRPKPIVQNTIDLDSLDAIQQLDLMEQAGEVVPGGEMIAKQQQPDGSMLHYYYDPNSRKLRVGTQTSEVLLLPQSDRNRVFYPALISMHPTALSKQEPNWRDEFYMQVLNSTNGTNEDVEDAFTRQCQRPPVPGREGDEKSSEENGHNKDNSNYVEGKRSLLNYGMDRSRLEKILEKRMEEKEKKEIEVQQQELLSSQTLPSESKTNLSSSKQASRYLTGPKKKKARKRAQVRSMSQHSIRYTAGLVSSSNSSPSSSDSSTSVSSSGGEGDIESDLNPHDDQTVPPRPAALVRVAKQQNVYDQVQADECDEAFGGSDGIEGGHNSSANSCLLPAYRAKTSATLGPAPSSHYPPAPDSGSGLVAMIAAQFEASQERMTLASSTAAPPRISNYHLGSESLRNNNNCNVAKQNAPNQGAATRPKPLYHSAKYKRQNTPL